MMMRINILVYAVVNICILNCLFSALEISTMNSKYIFPRFFTRRDAETVMMNNYIATTYCYIILSVEQFCFR